GAVVRQSERRAHLPHPPACGRDHAHRGPALRARRDTGHERPGGTDATFVFTPDLYASVVTVVGQPLDRDVTPLAATGAIGQLYVSLIFLADSTTRTFGPFDALVH